MVDIVKIFVKAGNGGDGRVSFIREKYRPKGGPDGGDGGDGGSVIIITDKTFNTLSHLHNKAKIEAEVGEKGGKYKKHGKKSADIYIKVPIGTIIRSKIEDQRGKSGEEVADLDKEDLAICVAKGGRGGRGNWHFRSATNQTPQEFEIGGTGEARELILELKLLANIGLIGLPNAGKSTLLSVLTKARPKIASYPFTTLEPNLGVMEISRAKRKEQTFVPSSGRGRGKSLVIADIPGLIEGASKGKGLGDQFLRHIERTRVLVHLVEPPIEEKRMPSVMHKNYLTIRKELKEYGAGIEEKPEIVVISKIDILTEVQIKKIKTFFKKKGLQPLFISAATHKGLEQLIKKLAEAFSV